MHDLLRRSSRPQLGDVSVSDEGPSDRRKTRPFRIVKAGVAEDGPWYFSSCCSCENNKQLIALRSSGGFSEHESATNAWDIREGMLNDTGVAVNTLNEHDHRLVRDVNAYVPIHLK